MRNYKPAIFQPTVRPNWGGSLSYIPDSEKVQILEAIIKYPSVECDSKFWNETIKPDLDLQYAEFKRLCEAKSRSMLQRWGKTSTTPLQDDYKTTTRGVIDPIEVEVRVEEDVDVSKREILNNSRNDISKLSTTRTQQFNPPTLEQVIEYAKQQNEFAGVGGFACTQELAEQFWSHYESIGWRVGNENRTPIVNWQSKLRNWSAKEHKTATTPPKETEKERKARENHEKLEELIRQSREAQKKDEK